MNAADVRRIQATVSGDAVVISVIGVDADHQNVFVMIEASDGSGYPVPGGPMTTFHLSLDVARRLAVLLTDAAQTPTEPTVVPDDDEKLLPFPVHHLHHGVAACAGVAPAVRGLPQDWPEGHRWSADWGQVTCSACLLHAPGPL